jgi:hypothetical protein
MPEKLRVTIMTNVKTEIRNEARMFTFNIVQKFPMSARQRKRKEKQDKKKVTVIICR